MTLLFPVGLLALGLAVPIVLLHMLTPRRPPTPVSSLLHWDGLRHNVTAAEPWQKLRWSLLLILQILAVTLLAVALARPATVDIAELSEHTVFIIDTSGSMAAIDGSPDRLASAVDQAKALRMEMPDSGTASIVVASANPTTLVAHSVNTDEYERAIDTLRTTAGGADYEAAFALAEALVLPDGPTGYVLISDGHLDDIEQKLAPPGTRFVPVGEADTNRAVNSLAVSAVPGGLQALVTVASTGGPNAIQILRLDVDGVTVLSRQIEIPKGQVFEDTFELPAGTRVSVFLDGEDLLAYDNQRYVGAPVLGSLKARIHGESTFFIDQLLAAIPDVETDVALAEEVDFEVYVGVAVPIEPTAPFIAIDVPGGVPGVRPVGRLDNPIPTLVANNPLLADIDVSRVAIAESQLLQVTSGDVLLGAPGAPLIVSGETNGMSFFYVAFTLEQSNLPIDVAFPIVGARMVGALASVDGVADALTVGDPIPLGATGGTVTDPLGNRVLVSIGDSEPIADRAGFWVVQRDGEDPLDIAVNPNSTESHLQPITELPGIRAATDGEESQSGTATIARSLLGWLLAALLLLLGIEFYVSFRSRGVSPRQWRWGVAARLTVIALIILALVNPVFRTKSDDVTTVFVVDVSASVGDSNETARTWVESALTEAGSGKWAIVEFGDDARVGTPLGTGPYRAARGVDSDATNIARGLRLGESVLTGETKQRLVLVSDGRVNTGDLQAELDRLKALGVVVDVHAVSGEDRTDAAIAGIDIPSSVNAGETFDATVEIVSTISGRADVELEDSNGLLSARRIDVEPGSNIVTFAVEAGEPGLQHLSARVRMSGDAVPENDFTKGAVEVKGPASVMVVEGEENGGTTIAQALESKGLVVARVSIEDLPGLEEISIHRGIVLVDVSARDLSDEKMVLLGTFVRDLGRGLVTVGGTHAYGLGGYRDTPLEALLPLDSEATDAKREAEVAEVLLIDTSESMGACHCDPSGEGGGDEGGVNKTDISKAAAVRAIEALGSGDEVGLLAFSGTNKWVIPLQEFPSRGTIDEGVSSLRPFGETRIVPALREAADALRASDKELKHIILFTDGFTVELDIGAEFVGDPFQGDLVEEVAKLAEEGITVSVVGTGEGAIAALEEVAIAGRGRFYPGRDLDEIPEIFVKEARIASRSFINEGEYYPAVTSTAVAVRDLGSSPPLLGFVATSPKPTADIQLQIGEFADPLLASWRVGLGKVTSWTSDGGEKWSTQWAAWDGYADFWSDLVRDTFPLAGSEGQHVEARIADELMTITLEGAEAWAPGTEPLARVSFPDGTTDELRLERVSEFEFSTVVPARQGGIYAVGVTFDRGDSEKVVMSAIASRSFAAEFLPGEPDPNLLVSISANTGGRGEITAQEAFDPEGLEEGSTTRTFRWWFLLAAALLWPLDVALRRLRLSRRAARDQQPQSSARQSTPTTPSDAPAR
jgi:Mg-chelatase subunit ChlD